MSAILAIETSGEFCSAALVDGRETVSRRARVGNAHSDRVLDMVRDVTTEAGIALAACDALAFGAGPGSFTGLRIACAVAQGLAFGAGLPVVAIGTLTALAESLPCEMLADGSSVVVVQDARMGELYWSALRWQEGAWCIDVPASLSTAREMRDDLRLQQKDAFDLGCGNAWTVYGDVLDGLAGHVVHRNSPDAVHVARLGLLAWRRGEAVAPEHARPNYVRNRIALTTAERDAGRHAPSAMLMPATS